MSSNSAPGATTFRVTLPAAPADALERSESAVKSAPPPASPRGRVLVVDDEPSLLSAIETLLVDHHDVVTAPGPREALATLADDHRFDVVLTDLMMAGMSGIDLHDTVRDHHPGLERRFVFMTGGAFSQREQTFLAETRNRCLEKPFEGKELLEAVAAIVGAES